MNKVVNLIISVFSFIVSFAFAQDFTIDYNRIGNYQPAENYFNSVCGGFDSIYRGMSYQSRDERDLFKKALESTKKTLKSLASDGYLMKNDFISGYLQVMANKIKNKNELLHDKKFDVYVYRSVEPNAANYGNGVILFNLNLVAKFNREEYVAFVLCHEMAHDVKKHVLDDIKKSYELNNDTKLKEKFNKLKKQEYRQLSSYEAYITDYLHRYTSRMREHEIEADSLGLVLYTNAGYKTEHAYRVMQLLDSIDAETYVNNLNYEKKFNVNNFRFDRSWLVKEEEDDGFGGNLKGIIFPDSLKTHPDCKIRLRKMKEQGLESGNGKVSAINYSEVNQVSKFEMLEVYKKNYEISKGLYHALHLSEEYPENKYLKASIVEFIYELYNSRVNHYFSVVADPPGEKYCNSYKELLNFLNNTNSTILKDLLEAYFKHHFESIVKDPYVAYVLSLLKTIEKNKDQVMLVIKDYEFNFGNNSYLLQLKTKFGIKN